MPLLVGAETFGEAELHQVDSDGLGKRLTQHEVLQDQHIAFREAGVQKFLNVLGSNMWQENNLADDASNLMVLQRECASVLPGQFKWCGSEDTTTCHIVFIQARFGSRKIVVTHVDCDEADQQLEIACRLFSSSSSSSSFSPQPPFSQPVSTPAASSSSLDSGDSKSQAHQLDEENAFDLFVVGGYLDEELISQGITRSILRFAMSSPSRYHLRLFFVGALNTVPHPNPELRDVAYPWTRGALMDMRTSNIRAFESIASSKHAYRVHRNLVQYTDPAVLMHTVFEAECDQLVIGPYPFAVPDQIGVFAKLPDEYILRFCSTSPHTESARFPFELRQVFLHMLQLKKLKKPAIRSQSVKCIRQPALEPSSSSSDSSCERSNWIWINPKTGQHILEE